MKLRLPRPLILFLLTAAVVVVGLGLRFGIPIYRQFRALEELRQCRAHIDARRVGPEWLKRCVGEERMSAFDEVVGLRFLQEARRYMRASGIGAVSGTWARPGTVNDSALVWARDLPDLTNLNLGGTSITDAGIEYVSGLRKLEILNLDGTDVSDKCIPLLTRFTNLRELSLRATPVADAGIFQLCALSNLQKLDLSQTQITDASLEPLSHLSNLETLDLSETQVTDKGLMHLKSLGCLRTLYLEGTLVTGDGMRALWRPSLAIW